MVRPDKKTITTASIALTALLCVSMVTLLFMPHIKQLDSDIKRLQQSMVEEKMLLARKPALQEEWEQKKGFFSQGVEPDAVLNTWVKELLASAGSQGLNLEKLEPAGIKTGAGGQELTVFISFQGDIKKFIKFVYELIDKDPLSKIESCDLRMEEGQAALSFELMLGKTVK